MAEKKGTVPFAGTKEQEEALKKVIEELKSEKGALMPILQKAQDIYGYLPMEVQKMISDQTGIPMEKIYGVATFYSQFTLSPKGRYRISVCLEFFSVAFVFLCQARHDGHHDQFFSRNSHFSGPPCLRYRAEHLLR